MRRDDFDDWRLRFDQLDEYVEKVGKAQRDFSRLTIRLALEVDYLPGQQEWIRELAARHPWGRLPALPPLGQPPIGRRVAQDAVSGYRNRELRGSVPSRFRQQTCGFRGLTLREPNPVGAA